MYIAPHWSLRGEDGSGRGAREVMEIAMKSTETEAGMLRMSYSELFNAGAALAAN